MSSPLTPPPPPPPPPAPPKSTTSGGPTVTTTSRQWSRRGGHVHLGRRSVAVSSAPRARRVSSPARRAVKPGDPGASHRRRAGAGDRAAAAVGRGCAAAHEVCVVTRTDRVYAVAVDTSGKRLAIGGRDKCVAMYDSFGTAHRRRRRRRGRRRRCSAARRGQAVGAPVEGLCVRRRSRARSPHLRVRRHREDGGGARGADWA